MKRYRVIITPDAEADLKVYLSYLRNVKKNPQAVKNVLEGSINVRVPSRALV